MFLSRSIDFLINLILKLNEINNFRDDFRVEEKRLEGLLGELLKAMDSLPKGSGDLSIDIEYWDDELKKKIDELEADNKHENECSKSLSMIRSNCMDLIEGLIKLERFGEGAGDEEQEGDEIGRAHV